MLPTRAPLFRAMRSAPKKPSGPESKLQEKKLASKPQRSGYRTDRGSGSPPGQQYAPHQHQQQHAPHPPQQRQHAPGSLCPIERVFKEFGSVVGNGAIEKAGIRTGLTCERVSCKFCSHIQELHFEFLDNEGETIPTADDLEDAVMSAVGRTIYSRLQTIDRDILRQENEHKEVRNLEHQTFQESMRKVHEQQPDLTRKLKVYEKIDSAGENETCRICYDAFLQNSDNAAIRYTCCSAQVHFDCAQKNYQFRQTCPFCMMIIPEK